MSGALRSASGRIKGLQAPWRPFFRNDSPALKTTFSVFIPADVLYFLVGSDEEGRGVPPARVVKFMEESGLMKATRGGGALRITDKG